MVTREQIEAACNDDEDALAVVIKWLYSVLRPYVRARVPTQDQEDRVQLALHDILRKMADEAPREPEAFRRWALGFTRMELLKYWRKQKRDLERHAEQDVEVEPSASTSAPDRMHQFRLLRVLNGFLRRLPPQYRLPLLHRFGEGGDTSFAEKHDIKKGTVRWRRHEARRRLQAMFRSYFELGSEESLWRMGPATPRT